MTDLLLAARVTLEQVLIVGGVLFAIGLYIALSKKNAVAAAEAAVVLALAMAVYRHRGTIDIDKINLLRW